MFDKLSVCVHSILSTHFPTVQFTESTSTKMLDCDITALGYGHTCKSRWMTFTCRGQIPMLSCWMGECTVVMLSLTFVQHLVSFVQNQHLDGSRPQTPATNHICRKTTTNKRQFLICCLSQRLTNQQSEQSAKSQSNYWRLHRWTLTSAANQLWWPQKGRSFCLIPAPIQ